MQMKPNGTMKFLNKQPYLLFSHRDLSLVKHIVALAPQEAQWFHCVERIEAAGDVYYKLTEMLMPEQYCSAAEVDTDSNMMISFYKQLKEQFGDETNEVMQKMTCWCHSHHNMGVGPSGQDRKQFKEQVELAIKRNVTTPQIMIIFNKKNDYYCQIYDPELDIHVENAPMVMEGYDFSEYTEIAKKNFKKKKVATPKRTLPMHRSSQGSFLDWHTTPFATSTSQNMWSAQKKVTPMTARKESLTGGLNLEEDDIGEYVADVLDHDVYDIFSPTLTKLEKNAEVDINKFLREIESYLSPSELIAFDLLLAGTEEEIRVLEEAYPDEMDPSLDTENALISLFGFFSDNSVSEEDFYTALAMSKLVTADSVTLPESEFLIDYWIDWYNAASFSQDEDPMDLYHHYKNEGHK
jgi:hypothetical protein